MSWNAEYQKIVDEMEKDPFIDLHTLPTTQVSFERALLRAYTNGMDAGRKQATNRLVQQIQQLMLDD